MGVSAAVNRLGRSLCLWASDVCVCLQDEIIEKYRVLNNVCR